MCTDNASAQIVEVPPSRLSRKQTYKEVAKSTEMVLFRTKPKNSTQQCMRMDPAECRHYIHILMRVMGHDNDNTCCNLSTLQASEESVVGSIQPNVIWLLQRLHGGQGLTVDDPQ